MKCLSPKQLKRAAELLDIIVGPEDADFFEAIAEAQDLLGYERPKPRSLRSFYGIHKPVK